MRESQATLNLGEIWFDFDCLDAFENGFAAFPSVRMGIAFPERELGFGFDHFTDCQLKRLVLIWQ